MQKGIFRYLMILHSVRKLSFQDLTDDIRVFQKIKNAYGKISRL